MAKKSKAPAAPSRVDGTDASAATVVAKGPVATVADITDVVETSVEEQVTIKLTAEVRFDEWLMTAPVGQVMTVRRSLLDDVRLAGKHELI